MTNERLQEVPAPVAAEPELPTVPVRASDNPRRIDSWALVLLSKGLSPLLRWADGALELHVPRRDAEPALAELDAADAEEVEAQRAALADADVVDAPATRHAPLGAVFLSLVLLAFYLVTGPRAAGADWFLAGSSSAERVLDGQWWRVVTALTLHADAGHVVGNSAIGAVVVGAVMRSTGVGWGAALVLAAGALGNLINAWTYQAHHSSVGASTSVFGAIGILGGLAYVHRKRRVRGPRPAWTALGGSLALLAMLGMSERSDILAHLFGGVVGVGLGLAVGWSGWRPSTAAGQWLAGLAAAAIVVGSWCLALA